jgi:hypothetical protein
MGRKLAFALTLIAVAALSVEPAEVRVPPQVFLSEYVEGADGEALAPFDKAIELTNATGAPVSLDVEEYVIQIWSYNGSIFTWELAAEVPLAGTIPVDGVFVVVNASTTNPQLLAAADQLSGSLFFDGDDAVLLAQAPAERSPERQAVYWDVIGWIAGPPPPGGAWTNGSLSTMDMVLRRSADIVIPDVNPFDGFTLDPAQWQGFPPDSFGGLGVGGFVPVELASFTAE